MANEQMQYQLKSWYGGTYTVSPWINMYANDNNLYLGLNCKDESGEFWEPFGDVTVNIAKLPYLYSAIDTNNNGDSIVQFLEENGFGTLTPFTQPSGFCVFPVFLFNEDKLRQIDPKAFAEYQKAHGRQQPLSEKIAAASGKAGEAETKQPGKEKESQR